MESDGFISKGLEYPISGLVSVVGGLAAQEPDWVLQSSLGASAKYPAQKTIQPAHGAFFSVRQIFVGKTRAESYTETSMESTLVIGVGQAAEGALSTNRTLGAQPVVFLCSQVPGRERWYVDALEVNPRLAAAVELVLRSEEGILD